ncbi:MAG: AbrB/MazE/SpoVT family DNA-binding domain-containing protein [Candidatus Promineofilum sp.]|mgnify:FL=1|jgi:AbrB family looped-hinge helix DNA binding protein|nr:AbrB/MazE/SpoVT family DNA-binding domain-containing protein [Promineifilum sp.]
MAIQATITGKNQITIPAAIARALGIEPGMKLEFELTGERAVVMRPVESRAEKVRRLEGMLRPYLPPGADPIGDLIREREQDDEEMGLA